METRMENNLADSFYPICRTKGFSTASRRPESLASCSCVRGKLCFANAKLEVHVHECPHFLKLRRDHLPITF